MKSYKKPEADFQEIEVDENILTASTDLPTDGDFDDGKKIVEP